MAPIQLAFSSVRGEIGVTSMLLVCGATDALPWHDAHPTIPPPKKPECGNSHAAREFRFESCFLADGCRTPDHRRRGLSPFSYRIRICIDSLRCCMVQPHSRRRAWVFAVTMFTGGGAAPRRFHLAGFCVRIRCETSTIHMRPCSSEPPPCIPARCGAAIRTRPSRSALLASGGHWSLGPHCPRLWKTKPNLNCSAN